MSVSTDEPSPEESEHGLRILAVNKRSWRHPHPGGAEIHLENTLKQLAEMGHEVTLLTGSDAGRPAVEQDNGVEIRRVGYETDVSKTLQLLLDYLVVTLYFHYFVRKADPDVVFTVNTPLPWLIVTDRPRVGIFHHISIETFFETHSRASALLGYVSQWIAVIQARANHTISVSPSTTAELLERGHASGSVHEIKNGLDISRYSVGELAESPRILYLGGLERYKGADRLSEIHRRVEEQYGSPVHLDVAGRGGPIEETIEAYCATTPTATFHGYVSEEEKVELMQRAWVFIAPSRVEGWGLAVLEANACGTPAVGTRVNGLRDSIRHEETGLLVDEGDLDEFAAAVTRALRDDRLRGELESNARTWAEQHTWEKAGERISAVFEAVAREDRPA